jgi:hypothetical protein
VLRDIIDKDVEFDSDGQVAGIVQREAGDRIISVTDPDMRHGRKSASVLIQGFKVQVIASLCYGWILLTQVFRANEHDGRDLPALVDELSNKHGLNPRWVGGDHAYGTIANHMAFAQREGTELIARMPRPSNGGQFTKDEFDIDFDTATLRCPGGHSQQCKYATRHGQKGWLFNYPAEVCGACPLRSQCVSPKANKDKGRSVFMVEAQERLIRAHLTDRQKPDFQAKLAQRVKVEHTIAAFAQCGGKSVTRLRESNVDFDVGTSALATNFRRLGFLIKKRPELRVQLQELLAALHARRASRCRRRAA